MSGPRQHCTLWAFGMPLVMSTCDRMQLTHIPEGFGCMLALHSAQSTLLAVSCCCWICVAMAGAASCCFMASTSCS